MKPTQLNAWPELECFFPLLASPSEASKLTTHFHINFSACDSVDSCGSASFLLKLLQYIERAKITNKTQITWNTNDSENESNAISQAISLGFFNFIKNSYRPALTSNIDLFCQNPLYVVSNFLGSKKTSFPVFHIQFSKYKDRRDAIKPLKKYMFDNLLKFENFYPIKIQPIIYVIFEIAKNSADHTNKDAFFGIDIIENEKIFKLQFFYGDLGEGIVQSVVRFINKNDTIYAQRTNYLFLSEAYHIACQKGFTSKPNSKKNLGMGLATIIELTKGMGMHLSVFDASSRGTISKFDIMSHAAIRRNLVSFSRKNPFCYFGNIEVEKP